MIFRNKRIRIKNKYNNNKIRAIKNINFQVNKRIKMIINSRNNNINYNKIKIIILLRTRMRVIIKIIKK
jgi:hypothetical protein